MHLNRMHALGLLIARYRAVWQARFHESSASLSTILLQACATDVPRQERFQPRPPAQKNDHKNTELRRVSDALCAHEKASVPVREMTLRQLRDSVQSLQSSWFKLRLVETFPPVVLTHAVDALFHRFGVLASQGWPISTLDDQGSIEPCLAHARSNDVHPDARWGMAVQSLAGKDEEPGSTVHQSSGTSSQLPSSSSSSSSRDLVRLNSTCIRRFVNVFLAFYRCMHLFEASEEIPADASAHEYDCGIRIHHIVAAAEDFNRLSMHWDLMPAAKLNYIHDFRGYYNCISQVFLSCRDLREK